MQDAPTNSAAGPWRLLVFDPTDPGDPRLLIVHVAEPGDVRPGGPDLDPVSRAWVSYRCGRAVTLETMSGVRAWRIYQEG
jgi:hypothetical protein